MGGALARAAAGKRQGQRIFEFELPHATDKLNEAAARLGIKAKLSLYQCRHGGAAHDLMGKYRARGDIQVRGRWHTETSLKRYTKTGKVQQMVKDLAPAALAFANRSLGALANVLGGRAAALTPPDLR